MTIRISFLRLGFWACWAGAVFGDFASFFNYSLTREGGPMVASLVAGLCFSSAALIGSAPHLCRLGMWTLTLPVLFVSLMALIGMASVGSRAFDLAGLAIVTTLLLFSALSVSAIALLKRFSSIARKFIIALGCVYATLDVWVIFCALTGPW